METQSSEDRIAELEADFETKCEDYDKLGEDYGKLETDAEALVVAWNEWRDGEDSEKAKLFNALNAAMKTLKNRLDGVEDE